MRLPFRVEPDQVQAEFNNGVLTVTLRKTKEHDRARRIQIQGGGQRRVEARQDSPLSAAQKNKGEKQGKTE